MIFRSATIFLLATLHLLLALVNDHFSVQVSASQNFKIMT